MVKLNLKNIFNLKNGKIILAIFLFILLMISLVKCFMSSTDKMEGLAGDKCPNDCTPTGDRGILFPSVFDGSVNGFYTIPKYACIKSGTNANPIVTSGNDSDMINAAFGGNCWNDDDCVQCGIDSDNGDKTNSSKGEQEISFNQIKIVNGCPKITWCNGDGTNEPCVDLDKKPSLTSYFDTPTVNGICTYGQVVPSNTQPKTILPFEYRKCKAKNLAHPLASYDCSENVNLFQDRIDMITNPAYLAAKGITKSFSSSSYQYGGFPGGNMAGSGSFNSPNNNYTGTTSLTDDTIGTTSLTDDTIPPGTNLSNPANIQPIHCGPNSVLKQRSDGSWYCKHTHSHTAQQHHLLS